MKDSLADSSAGATDMATRKPNAHVAHKNIGGQTEVLGKDLHPLIASCVSKIIGNSQLRRGIVHRLIVELRYLWYSLPVLIFHCWYLFYVCTTVFRKFAFREHVPGPMLKDLGYSLLAQSVEAKWWSEMVLVANIVVTVSFALLTPVISPWPHSKGMGSLKIAVEMFTAISVGHTLRFMSYAVTSLPGPAGHCRPGAPGSTFGDNSIFTSVAGISSPNCGDLIFSGHMMQDIIFTLAMTHYRAAFFQRAWLRVGVPLFLWFTVVVQGICIVKARNHYTVDVVVASYVAPLLWYAVQGIFASAKFQYLLPSYIPDYRGAYDKRKHDDVRAPSVVV